MGVLTKEQLDSVWEDQGLVHRMGRFRGWLVERGLRTHITAEKIQTHFYEVLEAFFVTGVEETPDGKQSIPARTGAPEVSDTASENRR